jgi:hypothetical protein
LPVRVFCRYTQRFSRLCRLSSDRKTGPDFPLLFQAQLAWPFIVRVQALPLIIRRKVMAQARPAVVYWCCGAPAG